MIYEETYQFLLRNVSSKEFDVFLYSLLKTDWNGYIRASFREIARNTGTTRKYAKQIFKKFSNGRGKKVLVPVRNYAIGSEKELYQLNLGKTALYFNEKTDKYCKKYNFFYTEAFRELPISAKRLVLIGAFKMSTTKNEEVMVNVEEIVPTSHNKNFIPFTKKRLIEAIEAVNASPLRKIVSIGLATNIYTEKEVVVFRFAPNTLNEYKENLTERELVRKTFVECGYTKWLPDEVCIELERVGKYLFDSLLNIEKEIAKKVEPVPGTKDEIEQIARFTYLSALKKLGAVLATKEKELDEPKKISAYFSSILYDVVSEEMAKYGVKVNYLKTVIEAMAKAKRMYQESEHVFNNTDAKNVARKEKFFHQILSILKNWCKNWVISRIKGIAEDAKACVRKTSRKEIMEQRRWKNSEDILKNVDQIKTASLEIIQTLEAKLKKTANQFSLREIQFLDDLKNEISDEINRYTYKMNPFLVFIDMASTG